MTAPIKTRLYSPPYGRVFAFVQSVIYLFWYVITRKQGKS